MQELSYVSVLILVTYDLNSISQLDCLNKAHFIQIENMPQNIDEDKIIPKSGLLKKISKLNFQHGLNVISDDLEIPSSITGYLCLNPELSRVK